MATVVDRCTHHIVAFRQVGTDNLAVPSIAPVVKDWNSGSQVAYYKAGAVGAGADTSSHGWGFVRVSGRTGWVDTTVYPSTIVITLSAPIIITFNLNTNRDSTRIS